jgi:ABC-2 type transport system ATP-binding protein
MTILYTTHLMEEAQELSDRVGIIDHGEIIATGTQEELTHHVGQEDRLEFLLGAQTVSEALLTQIQETIPGVTKAFYTPPEQLSESSSQVKPASVTAFARNGQTALPGLISLLDRADLDIHAVEIREPDLEAVFLALTGRALRD